MDDNLAKGIHANTWWIMGILCVMLGNSCSHQMSMSRDIKDIERELKSGITVEVREDPRDY